VGRIGGGLSRPLTLPQPCAVITHQLPQHKRPTMYSINQDSLFDAPRITAPEAYANALQAVDLDEIRRRYVALPKDQPARTVTPSSPRLFERYRAELLAGPRAIPTPFPRLNAACRGLAAGTGLQTGSLYWIAAGSGIGKSLFALPFLDKATRDGIPSAYLNLEMPGIETYTRMLAQSTRTPIRLLEPGTGFSVAAFDRAVTGFLKGRSAPLYMNDRPHVYSARELVQIIEVMAVELGVKLFALDFIQRVRVDGGHGRRDEIESASRQLDDVAKRLDITILGLSQLTREASRDLMNTPTPSDLQWSSALEQDARGVFVLDHTRLEDAGTFVRFALRVAKNRSGAKPDVIMRQDKVTLAIEEDPCQGQEWDHATSRWFLPSA
jgi:replicative DNA helicase